MAVLGAVLCGAALASLANAPVPSHTPGSTLAYAVRADTVQTDSTRVEAPFLHRVRRGDTLYSLARRYGLTVDELQRRNGLTGAVIVLGQGLVVGRADAAWDTFHLVKPGDTVYSIALRYGLTAAQLQHLNGLAGPAIDAGQRLAVPRILPDSPLPAVSVTPDTASVPAIGDETAEPAVLEGGLVQADATGIPTEPGVAEATPDTTQPLLRPPATVEQADSLTRTGPATPVPPALTPRAPDSLANALNVFLDCERCDNRYIRTEITFVNHVRERQEAQVHLLITTQRTGGGREYTLTFIGREEFAGVNDTLRYVSSDTDTDDERREGMVKVIKMGLVRYVARTPLADRLAITFDAGQRQTRQMTSADDKWNFWVFRMGVNGSYEAEESANFLRFSSDLSASRVTEAWKTRLSLFGSYRESHFDLGEEGKVTSTNRNGDIRGLVVRSLGPHWAAGGFASVSTSSFNNTDLSLTASPAIEYNVFPYAESTRREFRFSYFLNIRYFDYEAVTVFGKTSEVLLRHELEASFEVRQPWGNAEASIELSDYLYDLDANRSLLDFYRVEVSGFIELRLVRGLSFFAHGGASRIRDQLFLPAEEASEEDILLRNRRLPTSYEYSLSVGFSYTFGSIYNNVVNSRFGS